MQKKLFLLINGQQNSLSLLNYFDHYEHEDISYDRFKKGVIDIISGHKDKVKLSEDDVKTIFHLLDQ